MIELSFRIGLFLAALGGIIAFLALLPNQLPDEVITSILYFINSVNQWSYFLPLHTLGIILGLSIGFWTMLAFWDIGSWLLTKITR